MDKGATICVKGGAGVEVARALAVRLLEMGCNVERLDADVVKRLGGAKRAAFVCGLLSRNGVFVVATTLGGKPEGELLDVEIDEYDTPDFAAEKVIDELAERGLLRRDSAQYTPEEEELIQKRLADLGYVE